MSAKPLIIACACPLAGHVGPVLSLSRILLARGYEITFVTGNAFEEDVIKAGLDFFPLEGRANFQERTLHEIAPDLLTLPPGLDQTGYSIKEIFVKSIPDQYDALQKALKKMDSKGRPIVVIAETMFFGTHPINLDTPGIKPAGVITLGTIPCMLPGEREPGVPSRDPRLTYAINEKVFKPGSNEQKSILAKMGSKREPDFLLDHIYSGPDCFLQLCPPSLEFNITNKPSKMKFAGSAPHTSLSHSGAQTPPELPDWWQDLKYAERVIVVSQGTAAINYEDLLSPALEALADQPNILVVGILGIKGAKLPENVKVPGNARICDYLPYDEILRHTDVFIYNGGYGGLQHSMSHGVPVIIGGGMLVDKPAVAARASWAGVGYDLQTIKAKPEQIQEAVFKVLNTPSFRERAKKVQKELEDYQSAEILEQNILELIV